MSHHSSAAKRHRQSEVRRIRNRAIRSQIRTTVRQFLVSVEANEKEEATEKFNSVTRLIDSASHKGVYHRNTAARTKSRLARRLHSMA